MTNAELDLLWAQATVEAIENGEMYTRHRFAAAVLSRQLAEIERLRAELEALRKQEPVAWMNVRNGFICKKPTNADYQQPLYLAAGAQPEPDANCITLPDGSCVGGLMAGKPPCMHDRPSGAQPAPIPADAAQDLLAACKEFVRKVEAGEARSVRSYEQMKAAITKAENVQPAPSVPVEYVTDTTHEKVMDAIAVALGDAYDCLRVWGAWSYGTMSQDDFVQVVEQQDRLS